MRYRPRSIQWGISLIVIGLVIILHAAGVVDFWRIIGLLFGILLIWWGYRAIRRGRRASLEGENFTVFGDNVTEDASRHLEYSTVFGDTRIKAAGREFSRGNIKSVFGDLVIDLSNIESITEPGRLDLDSVFGDIRVRLPEGIEYAIEGHSVFGTTTTPGGTRMHGRGHRSPDFEGSTNRLRIHLSHVFGDNENTR
jgi:predicted membrane protein